LQMCEFTKRTQPFDFLLSIFAFSFLFILIMEANIGDFKRLVIIALASDEQLMDELVLKGGNAIEILEKRHTIALSRASYDLDFSIEDNFDQRLEEVGARIHKTISKTFHEKGLQVFDFKVAAKPFAIGEELKPFWGGYHIQFKVTGEENYRKAGTDIELLRKMAIPVLPNGSPKIEIEISKYEFVTGKIEANVDGYIIYIYSPEMIVFEKLRAICQQLPAYATVVPSHSPRPRARDFYDIYLMMHRHHIDPGSHENKDLIKNIFLAKRVPLEFIGEIHTNLELHRIDWQNVVDTLAASLDVEDFDFYAQYVLATFQPLTFD
jgi:predicted nucleotidyltransferase component of viral defense system